MPHEREIRAQYNDDTIVVYQAYSPQIAESAVKDQTFRSPFSFHRMTWVKPSFLWLMHRSNWAQKKNQTRTLAIHVSRAGWDKALSLGVLTHPEPAVYRNHADWDAQFQQATIHIQWDTERSLRGTGLNHYSIQVGISRHLIREFVDEWIMKIEDVSATVARIREFKKTGNQKHAKNLLPSERVYPVESSVANRLQMS